MHLATASFLYHHLMSPVKGNVDFFRCYPGSFAATEKKTLKQRMREDLQLRGFSLHQNFASEKSLYVIILLSE